MRKIKKWTIVLLSVIFIAGVFGCGEKGSAEKAGKKIDKAIEDTKKSIKKMVD